MYSSSLITMLMLDQLAQTEFDNRHQDEVINGLINMNFHLLTTVTANFPKSQLQKLRKPSTISWLNQTYM